MPLKRKPEHILRDEINCNDCSQQSQKYLIIISFPTFIKTVKERFG